MTTPETDLVHSADQVIAQAEHPGLPHDEHSPEKPAGHGYMSEKEKYLSRVRRIEGQARGIHRMIEDDTYCIDILTQISAMTSALENVGLALLDDHLKHCVAHAVQNGGDEAEEKLQEAQAAIRRLVKS
ncbi:metal-sensitive transcriptional regulator [Nesterenkonia halophila]|uniref:metal-sensitive transcriptional regulator n=1 Tax=Nesterenkonia halophila TaxID=302044 RepID=UPI001292B531|nr:metal-sensitive transcriptional regulator [Nesterenkonia halophila]